MPALPTPELERYLEQALDRDASDLWLIPGEPPAFRIEGKVVRGDGDALDAQSVGDIAAAAVGPDRAEGVGASTGVVQTTFALPGAGFARMSVGRSSGDLTICVRLIRGVVLGPEALRIPSAVIEATERPHGLVVLSGPAGSGKTTLAYALLEHLNTTRACHIQSVENPVELPLEPKLALIQQREVGLDVPDMLSGIRAAMFCDLDVLFVGDVPDLEVLQACLTTAETGHLVFLQLNLPTPHGAVRRIIDLQPDETRDAFREALSRELLCVVAPRLLPRVDRRGRIAAYSSLIPDAEMRHAIATGKDILDRTTPLPPGCTTLADQVAALEAEGLIAPDIARNAVS